MAEKNEYADRWTEMTAHNTFLFAYMKYASNNYTSGCEENNPAQAWVASILIRTANHMSKAEQADRPKENMKLY